MKTGTSISPSQQAPREVSRQDAADYFTRTADGRGILAVNSPVDCEWIEEAIALVGAYKFRRDLNTAIRCMAKEIIKKPRKRDEAGSNIVPFRTAAR